MAIFNLAPKIHALRSTADILRLQARIAPDPGEQEILEFSVQTIDDIIADLTKSSLQHLAEALGLLSAGWLLGFFTNLLWR